MCIYIYIYVYIYRYIRIYTCIYIYGGDGFGDQPLTTNDVWFLPQFGTFNTEVSMVKSY
jgi:hypothetical protein